MTKDWDRNYVHSLDWRWLTNRGRRDLASRGSGPTVDLVKGETMTPLERLFAVADDANGIGTKLDISKWTFMNTDLVVHVHRIPEGEWIGIRAETNYGPDGIGTTIGTLFDESGAVGGNPAVGAGPPPPAPLIRRTAFRQGLTRTLSAGYSFGASRQAQSRCGALRDGLLLPAVRVGRAFWWMSTLPSSCTSNTSSAIDSQMPCPVHLLRSTSTTLISTAAPILDYSTYAETRLMPCTKLLNR